ncbi:MAG: hypothetical protein ACRDYB_01700 [Acidimicrobiales bacterium]
MSGPADLPEAAPRRLESGSFSSGLTVPDFAACLQMGLRPVGLVQGFCAMQWGWSSMGYGLGTPYLPAGAYSQTYRCPHGYVGSIEHRTYGQNFEQSWVEDAWLQGFGSAFDRLIEEAQEVGAHGIIGFTDSTRALTDSSVVEFHLLGTAVVVEDGPPPPGGRPWSTYLAGQRLAKLLEAGFMPISVVAAVASLRVWANCVTAWLMSGGVGTLQTRAYWGGDSASTAAIDQISDAHEAVQALAREHARRQIGGDSIHGISIGTTEREAGEGDQVLECILRGTRVRRFKDFDPMPPARPTVRLT